MRRRSFVQIAGVAAGVSSMRPSVADIVTLKQSRTHDPLTPLTAFVDTLIPHDQSPGASDVGIDQILARRTVWMAGEADLLAGGCRWLDSAARRCQATDFRTAGEAVRIRVVEAAAASPVGSAARRFFDHVYEITMHEYYADPRVCPALNYDGPPQPRGFPDHTRSL